MCNHRVTTILIWQVTIKNQRPQLLRAAVDRAVSQLGGGHKMMADKLAKELAHGHAPEKLNASPNDFVCDDPSSKGLANLLGYSTRTLNKLMGEGQKSLEEEFAKHGNEVRHTHTACLRTCSKLAARLLQVDKECLNYVLHERAGIDVGRGKKFPNGIRDEHRDGTTFEDFCIMPEAVKAGLEPEEVLALRLYSMASFQSLNAPLRSGKKFTHDESYPFPATIGFLQSGIKKLREVLSKTRPDLDLLCDRRSTQYKLLQVSKDSGAAQQDLFRGMANMQVVGFLSRGRQ